MKSWEATLGMQETEALLSLAEGHAGKPVFEKSGVFRPAITQQQITDFAKREEEGIAIWKEDAEFGKGLWIPDGITVYSRLYLSGLWSACKAAGVEWVGSAVESLEELASFDRIVITAGFETVRFEGCKELPLEATKGQTLICRWPERLPFPLVSHGHITPTEDPALCQVGSTYERGYLNLEPDPTIALGLLQQIAPFYPYIKDLIVVDIRAGARISRPRAYRPLIEQIGQKTWVFTALGSRGLHYHAWLGKQVAQAVVTSTL